MSAIYMELQGRLDIRLVFTLLQYSCVMLATHLHGITGQIGLNIMEFTGQEGDTRDNNGDASKYRHYVEPLEQRMSGDN